MEFLEASTEKFPLSFFAKWKTFLLVVLYIYILAVGCSTLCLKRFLYLKKIINTCVAVELTLQASLMSGAISLQMIW